MEKICRRPTVKKHAIFWIGDLRLFDDCQWGDYADIDYLEIFLHILTPIFAISCSFLICYLWTNLFTSYYEHQVRAVLKYFNYLSGAYSS